MLLLMACIPFADIDECTSPGVAQCDVNADCYNEAGTYRCECREGYKPEKLGDPITGTCVGEVTHGLGLPN